MLLAGLTWDQPPHQLTSPPLQAHAPSLHARMQQLYVMACRPPFYSRDRPRVLLGRGGGPILPLFTQNPVRPYYPTVSFPYFLYRLVAVSCRCQVDAEGEEIEVE